MIFCVLTAVTGNGLVPVQNQMADLSAGTMGAVEEFAFDDNAAADADGGTNKSDRARTAKGKRPRKAPGQTRLFQAR